MVESPLSKRNIHSKKEQYSLDRNSGNQLYPGLNTARNIRMARGLGKKLFHRLKSIKDAWDLHYLSAHVLRGGIHIEHGRLYLIARFQITCPILKSLSVAPTTQ
jgi:hypothetical protein